eukprot:3059609-Rhodomonas_salina.2
MGYDLAMAIASAVAGQESITVPDRTEAQTPDSAVEDPIHAGKERSRSREALVDMRLAGKDSSPANFQRKNVLKKFAQGIGRKNTFEWSRSSDSHGLRSIEYKLPRFIHAPGACAPPSEFIGTCGPSILEDRSGCNGVGPEMAWVQHNILGLTGPKTMYICKWLLAHMGRGAEVGPQIPRPRKGL